MKLKSVLLPICFLAASIRAEGKHGRVSTDYRQQSRRGNGGSSKGFSSFALGLGPVSEEFGQKTGIPGSSQGIHSKVSGYSTVSSVDHESANATPRSVGFSGHSTTIRSNVHDAVSTTPRNNYYVGVSTTPRNFGGSTTLGKLDYVTSSTPNSVDNGLLVGSTTPNSIDYVGVSTTISSIGHGNVGNDDSDVIPTYIGSTGSRFASNRGNGYESSYTIEGPAVRGSNSYFPDSSITGEGSSVNVGHLALDQASKSSPGSTYSANQDYAGNGGFKDTGAIIIGHKGSVGLENYAEPNSETTSTANEYEQFTISGPNAADFRRGETRSRFVGSIAEGYAGDSHGDIHHDGNNVPTVTYSSPRVVVSHTPRPITSVSSYTTANKEGVIHSGSTGSSHFRYLDENYSNPSTAKDDVLPEDYSSSNGGNVNLKDFTGLSYRSLDAQDGHAKYAAVSIHSGSSESPGSVYGALPELEGIRESTLNYEGSLGVGQTSINDGGTVNSGYGVVSYNESPAYQHEVPGSFDSGHTSTVTVSHARPTGSVYSDVTDVRSGDNVDVVGSLRHDVRAVLNQEESTGIVYDVAFKGDSVEFTDTSPTEYNGKLTVDNEELSDYDRAVHEESVGIGKHNANKVVKPEGERHKATVSISPVGSTESAYSGIVHSSLVATGNGRETTTSQIRSGGIKHDTNLVKLEGSNFNRDTYKPSISHSGIAANHNVGFTDGQQRNKAAINIGGLSNVGYVSDFNSFPAETIQDTLTTASQGETTNTAYDDNGNAVPGHIAEFVTGHKPNQAFNQASVEHTYINDHEGTSSATGKGGTTTTNFAGYVGLVPVSKEDEHHGGLSGIADNAASTTLGQRGFAADNHAGSFEVNQERNEKANYEGSTDLQYGNAGTLVTLENNGDIAIPHSGSAAVSHGLPGNSGLNGKFSLADGHFVGSGSSAINDGRSVGEIHTSDKNTGHQSSFTIPDIKSVLSNLKSSAFLGLGGSTGSKYNVNSANQGGYSSPTQRGSGNALFLNSAQGGSSSGRYLDKKHTGGATANINFHLGAPAGHPVRRIDLGALLGAAFSKGLGGRATFSTAPFSSGTEAVTKA